MVAELVRRAQQHDAEAFTELVRRFQDAVFATAYQQVLDFEAARDLAQETFVRAYEKLATLREAERFPGWLIRISRNLALNHARRAEAHCLPLDARELPAADHAAAVQDRDLVARALASLPENGRLALSLALIDGYTCGEIAALTGASPSTVRGRIERAKRKLSQEVLPMLDETLKSRAPNERFTLEAVRASLARAEEALAANEFNALAAAGQEALDRLDQLAETGEEGRELRVRALQSVVYPTFFTDRRRWATAQRQLLAELQAKGDTAAVAAQLDMLVLFDDALTGTEREALQARSRELLRAAGRFDRLASTYFFAGWHALDRGEVSHAWQQFAAARETLAGQPYCVWHACLEATEEFRRLAGDDPEVSRRVAWGAQANEFDPDGRCQGGDGRPGSVLRDGPGHGKLAHGFKLLLWSGGLGETDLRPGYERDLASFSHTGNPTHTRLWVEEAPEAVRVPAGVFEGCLRLRATVTESPLDANLDTPQRGYNRLNCGEYACLLARGVGPVSCRHERADGMTEHTVLRATTAAATEAWLPLAAGTRWEYVPAEPDPQFEALLVVQVTHCDGEGKSYLGITTIADTR